jgi:glutathione S-transferase
MILIGQYDSPFVRRVAIALRLYAMPFEHRPWSTFGDADKIAPFNPLRRVPTLVLDDGETLLESGAILDHLDEMAGPERSLIAARGGAATRVAGLRPGDRTRRQVGEPVLRAGIPPADLAGLDRPLPGADRGRAGRAGK